MESRPIHLEIAQWVRQIFETGFQIGPAQMEMMEACFGICQLDDLLAGTHTSQAASFLDLLFSPGDDTRLAFETRWGHLTISEETVAAALEALQYPPLTTTLHLSNPSQPLRLSLSEEVLAVFLQRLNMAWLAPDSLHQMVQARVAEPHRPLVRSYLRRARLPWHANQLALLDLYLHKFATADEDFAACLQFLLSIADTLAPEANLFEFLVEKKLFYFQSLCGAEAFERRRQRTSIEILILQGERAAHGNMAEWRQLMRRVDRICQTLFGQTRFFQQPLVQQHE
ncbi:MAG: hypothetical protein M0036_15545 [Desulfobacteraceae bacterium]|nr:hypothetical protein [Desulfobacteraceae bacterium]